MFAAKQYVKLLEATGQYEAATVARVIWADYARDECVVRFADGRELTIPCSALTAADKPPAPILVV